MFEADSFSKLNFVLEFNLPKEISDSQDHIKLSVNRVEIHAVEIPVCPIGYKSRSFRTPGEIHCIEYYKCIQDVLPLINRWVNSIYCACNKLSSRSNQFIEANLYAYKQDGSLFRKWGLVEFYPLFNPNVGVYFSCDVVEMIFKFENAIIEEDDDKPMYDISKYIKEYKDRDNKCEFCAYHNLQGGRCYMCKNHNWFVQEINLKQYVIKRVSEDSTHEFKASEKAVALERKIDLRKNVYDDFNKYVEKQKEALDNELELKRKEWSELASDYALEMGRHISDNIDKALESLDSMKE